ncbi:hypothetical protein NDU88_003027 [Pleurodeles waltl]|uniref:Uncharacterized protein n=1 Tax=Pleurodeles waltl TaxID=8319 RepID=A0AAV7QAL1_PLEWA|nr:hypothetical protein NDU88_003027 [Pleurodeles waltl]
MDKEKRAKAAQSNKIAQYTVTHPGTPLQASDQGNRTGVEEQNYSIGRDLGTIPGSQIALETKKDMKAIEMNNLGMDLQKGDRVMAQEDDVNKLKKEIKTLRAILVGLKYSMMYIEAHFKGTEDHCRQNNTQLVGFPEYEEGPAEEFFLEDRIVNMLKNGQLSRFFALLNGRIGCL